MESPDRNNEDIRTLAGKLLTVQDDERRRISRDLHDDVNQRLGAIGLQLDSLCRRLPDAPATVRRQIRTIRRHVSELSDDVRQMAYRFHQTTAEDLGLQVALQRYIKDFVRRTGIKAQFLKPATVEAIPSRAATCLFRIAQESLGNVAKHAEATHVSIHLSITPDQLRLIIRDNGVGMAFDESPKRSGGLGLLSMQERARLLNGSVTWRSAPGAGTELTACLPWPTEEP